MTRYNHAVTLAFEVISYEENGEDITPEMLIEALGARMRFLDRKPKFWLEACLPPYDTHEEGVD